MNNQIENPDELLRLNWLEGNTPKFAMSLLEAFEKSNRVAILVPANQARLILQRIRTTISRRRAQVKAMGMPLKHFEITSDVFPYTNAKHKRYDCIVFRKVVSDRHKLREKVEGMYHGGFGGTAKEAINEGEFPEW